MRATIKSTLAPAKERGVHSLFSRPDDNPKVKKNRRKGVFTFPLHLAPARLSGFNVCSHASPLCENSCLHTAGNPIYMSGKERARLARTMLFFEDRDLFFDLMILDVARGIAGARKRNLSPGFRPNATSDLPYERIPLTVSAPIKDLVYRISGVRLREGRHDSIVRAFPRWVSWYDYTKIPRRRSWEGFPSNYHLTFSLAEGTDKIARAEVENFGSNVAVVFNGDLPAWHNLAGMILPVINGDKHDYRPVDPSPCIVGLTAKGMAKGKCNGFVRLPDHNLTVGGG